MPYNWTVQEILDGYRDHPMRIGVPKLVAYATAKLSLVSEERTWSPESGLVIHRGRSQVNVETFSLKQLSEANQPDIDYIAVVDAIRQFQLWWNFFARPLNEWFGLPVPVMEPLDRYGSILWRSATGQESIRLELVEKPSELAHLLEYMSRKVWAEIKLDREVDEQLKKTERIRDRWRARRANSGNQ